jgi:hypothetical protein
MGKAKEKWRKKAWMVNPNKARIILAATASQRRSIDRRTATGTTKAQNDTKFFTMFLVFAGSRLDLFVLSWNFSRIWS